MPKKIFNFNLDIYEKDIIPKFNVKQFDDCIFNISLKHGEYDFNAKNSTGVLYLACENEVFMQNTGIAVNDSSIIVTLNRSLLSKKGCAYAELELTDDSGTISSLSFMFNIEGKIGEGATIPDGIEGFVEVYTRLVEEFKKLIEKSKSTLQGIKEDYEGLRKIIIDENNEAKLQAQIDELRKAIENVGGNVNLENYATKEFVTNEINKVTPSLVPRFAIGNVVTLEPGQQATVTLRGTAENPILDFGIPRGRDGGSGGGTNIENNIVGSAKVGFARITL